ncbi:MAG: sugar ABC transporter ATP-binding protein [Spirochaetota bacterium]
MSGGKTGVLMGIRGLHKQFPGTLALDDVSFDIHRNTVHCIIGENGSGKSTMIKILTGALERSKGEILFEDGPFEPKTIRDAMARGVTALYQELNVVDDLTVEENLTLGRETRRFGMIRKSADLPALIENLRSLDESIDLGDRVGDLSVAQRQVIEIARAISTDCKMLVMDEPTASLSEEETQRMFKVIRKLVAKGITIVYISHKLSEVFEIGDEVTVLRDGKIVETRGVAEIRNATSCNSDSEACLELVRMMLGKVVLEEYIPSRNVQPEGFLEVRNVSTAKLHDVSFELHKGEILGFYGLVGAGKTEVAQVLYGIDAYHGEILFEGKPIRIHSIAKALKTGITLIPEERRVDGIFGQLSIRANVPMMRMEKVLRNGIINRAKENQLADGYIKSMSLATSSREKKVAQLSGGNQQKVVISKCLNRESDVLLMDEPTRGVDVGAKQEIHDIIRSLANEGKGVIVFSSELPEIMQLCDRIVLMFEGRVRTVLRNGKDIDSDRIMALVAGGEVSA